VQQDAAFWEDVIDGNGLEIGNDRRPTHHWTREDQEGDSVIDLTLANYPIEESTILIEDHGTGSNHEVTEWEVEVDRQEKADHGRVVGRNLAAIVEKDVEAAEKLRMQLGKNRAQLDADCMEKEVVQEATWCPERMSSVHDTTAKIISFVPDQQGDGPPTTKKEQGW
jgi:hypothetical protein